MVEVAVVGAAGYAGVEAVRWVAGHPALELTLVTSGADEGRAIADLYPALGSTVGDLAFAAPDPVLIASSASVALLAVPHTASLALTPGLLDAGMTVIDMSADFRLADPVVYEEWYATAHTASDLLDSAVYGLPEADRTRLPGARLVACPGCYPTATSLAAIPALEAGVCAADTIVVDAKSGVSGAGRQPSATVHFCSADESVAAYKVAAHRHTPEIEQTLTRAAGRCIRTVFTPHLVPLKRGLLSTVYLPVPHGFTSADAHELYHARYAAEPFVSVAPCGRFPSTAEVVGTNRAAIGVAVDERTSTLVAVCAIDNLGKGAAGQAVQCLNAVMGMRETEGLIGIPPVV